MDYSNMLRCSLLLKLLQYIRFSQKKKHCRSQWKALLLKASSSSNSILRLILQLPTELKTRWRRAKECPKKIYWEKKNVMKCDIWYMWFALTKTTWGHLWIHSCWLKTSRTFFKLRKTLHRIYSAKILLLPDILSVYYLQETDLISRSIWEKYSAKILGRNVHLMVCTFTGTKYRRFKYGIPAPL